jgi:hypothetical protein
MTDADCRGQETVTLTQLDDTLFNGISQLPPLAPLRSPNLNIPLNKSDWPYQGV